MKKEQLGVQEGFIFIPIYATTNRGKPIWQVPLGRCGNIRRAPRTFRSLAEAQDFARALARGQLNDQTVFGRISQEGIQCSMLIAELLDPVCAKLGIGLEQALGDYIAAKELAGVQPLEHLVNDYLSQPWVTKGHTPAAQAVAAFIDVKKRKGCRPETIRCLHHTLDPIVNKLGNPAVANITTSQLYGAVHRPNYAPRGNKTVYCSLHNFYGWLKRNGYLRSDIPSAMDSVNAPIVPRGRPAIIDVECARRAIQTVVRDLDPEYVLNFVIALFTGIRTDEIQRLLWKDVSPGERILVPGKKAKTRAPRHVPIQRVLDLWMRPFYGRKGFINSRVDPLLKVAKVLKRVGIFWKRDWLRHSYCSYRLAATGDLVNTAKEDGHSIDVLVRTYLQLVTKEEAKGFFALTPEACGVTDWDQRVAAFLDDWPECAKRRTNKRKTSRQT